MAKTKNTARKMSRRQMVTLLGSGVVFAGTIKGEDVSAAAQDVCNKPANVQKTSGPDGRLLLLADTCCLDGYEILHASYGGRKAAPSARGHLRALDDALVQAKHDNLLLEYCVMMWGLNKDQRDAAVRDLSEKYMTSKKAK